MQNRCKNEDANFCFTLNTRLPSEDFFDLGVNIITGLILIQNIQQTAKLLYDLDIFHVSLKKNLIKKNVQLDLKYVNFTLKIVQLNLKYVQFILKYVQLNLKQVQVYLKYFQLNLNMSNSIHVFQMFKIKKYINIYLIKLNLHVLNEVTHSLT